MKLTAAISASYFGAEVRTPDGDGVMTGIRKDVIGVARSNEFYGTWYDYDQSQLLLTPLSKISDEDAVEVAKILIPQCFLNTKKGWQVSRNYTTTGYPYIKIHHPKKVYSVQIDCTLVNFDIDDMEDRVTASCDAKPVALTDYLRSKGYDCGHGSIPSLIAAGVAVEKN